MIYRYSSSLCNGGAVYAFGLELMGFLPETFASGIPLRYGRKMSVELIFVKGMHAED